MLHNSVFANFFIIQAVKQLFINFYIFFQFFSIVEPKNPIYSIIINGQYKLLTSKNFFYLLRSYLVTKLLLIFFMFYMINQESLTQFHNHYVENLQGHEHNYLHQRVVE